MVGTISRRLLAIRFAHQMRDLPRHPLARSGSSCAMQASFGLAFARGAGPAVGLPDQRVHADPPWTAGCARAQQLTRPLNLIGRFGRVLICCDPNGAMFTSK
jgi:hypothetical protein